MQDRVVLASGNRGKIREIQSILCRFNIVPQSDLDIQEVDETGTTFIENAIIKARNATKHSGLPAIADDSGLEVDALNGAPGVYSARYAGNDASDAANLQKVLANLANVSDAQRSGRFHCVMVYMRHENDPCPIIAHGVWDGIILRDSRGSNGFGYDPIFYLPEQGCSSAELPSAEKNRLSHRYKALKELIEFL